MVDSLGNRIYQKYNKIMTTLYGCELAILSLFDLFELSSFQSTEIDEYIYLSIAYLVYIIIFLYYHYLKYNVLDYSNNRLVIVCLLLDVLGYLLDIGILVFIIYMISIIDKQYIMINTSIFVHCFNLILKFIPILPILGYYSCIRTTVVSMFERLFNQNTNTDSFHERQTQDQFNDIESSQLRFEKVNKDNGSLDRNCSICLESYLDDNIVCTLPCDHAFHNQCIKTWLEQDSKLSCPMCRKTIDNTS